MNGWVGTSGGGGGGGGGDKQTASPKTTTTKQLRITESHNHMNQRQHTSQLQKVE